MYSAVPTVDIESSNSSNDELLQFGHHNQVSDRPSRSRFLVQMLFSFVFSAAALSLGFWLGQNHRGDLNDVCIRHTSKYSPMLNDIDITYSEWQFNGSFKQQNIYRQDPSKEVDRAWEALGISNRVLVISEEEGLKAGLTPENHVQVNKKYGGGYPVMTEGMHQLHCLNLLRKSLWFQYDYYREHGDAEFINGGEPFRWHVTHCLDFLRQRLMCDVDIGVFGAVWYNASDPTPFVDFNTKHVCRNFDDVRKWATEHQTAEELPEDYWEEPGPEVIIRPDIP